MPPDHQSSKLIQYNINIEKVSLLPLQQECSVSQLLAPLKCLVLVAAWAFNLVARTIVNL
jgi:hypothetical protein